ncbi:DUF4397 domain-containing protein [Pedobacter frigoris]|uniref:DUF4397 domain-containing protein n=1 Tax=Pedobacter frigoris TaxID=2571272 RepID=A0A4U1CPN2_9SPHI|nr:DUF4397 domain-containing protein [Pedobacter frigoris]TKC08745.1 DUF4397 domain-containing protein [Pedobacter frigoris]
MKNSYFLSKRAGTALLMSCLSVVVLLSSCVKEPKPEPTGEASVRFVNAVQGSSAQDFYVNGVKKSTTALTYGNYSGYTTIVSGNNQFILADEGSTNAGAATDPVSVPIGSKLTVFYYRTASTATTPGPVAAGIIGADATAPETGKAKVRFLHLNSYYNNQSFAVSAVGGAQIIAGVGFRATSIYYQVAPGTKLSLTATGIVTGEIDPGFVAGKIYTIWFDGSSATELNSHVIVEN